MRLVLYFNSMHEPHAHDHNHRIG